MFSQLTKLLDRNFAIGYFLPSALFLGVSVVLLEHFKPVFHLRFEDLLDGDIVAGLGIAGLASWLIGVWLLAANRRIIRFKEGYGWWSREWNPVEWKLRWLSARKQRLRRRTAKLRLRRKAVPPRLRKRLERCSRALAEISSRAPRRSRWDRDWNPLKLRQERRFARLLARKRRLRWQEKELEEAGKRVPDEVQNRLAKCCLTLANQFPHRREWLLPSSLGNTIRAFELYPLRMYGFGAITGWCRLQGVIPAGFREQVIGAKAQMDFLLNLWLLSHLLVVEWAVLAWVTGRLEIVWFPLAALVSAAVASYWARQAAVEWGEMVKASFDLFLPALREQLGLPKPRSREEEREQWTSFSQAILYRGRGSLPEFDLASRDEPSAEQAPESESQAALKLLAAAGSEKATGPSP